MTDLKNKANNILSKIEAVEKERKQLDEELLEVLPVKIDERVNIINTLSNDAVVRQAFIQRIGVHITHKGKAVIEFKLDKCKKNGVRSDHSDRLNYGEQIQKIK